MYNPVKVGIAFFEAIQKSDPEESLQAILEQQLALLEAGDKTIQQAVGMLGHMVTEAIACGWAVQQGIFQYNLTSSGQQALQRLRAELKLKLKGAVPDN